MLSSVFKRTENIGKFEVAKIRFVCKMPYKGPKAPDQLVNKEVAVAICLSGLFSSSSYLQLI